MTILWIAIAVYFGFFYLVCWLLIFSKILSGGWSWKDLVISGLFAPIFLAIAVLFNPVKIFRGLKKEMEMRKNSNGV